MSKFLAPSVEFAVASERASVIGLTTSDRPLNTFISDFLLSVKHEYSTSYYPTVRSQLSQYSLQGLWHMPLADITPKALAQYYEQRFPTQKYSKSSMKNCRAVLVKLWDWLVEQGHTGVNVARMVKPSLKKARKTQEIRAYTDFELIELIALVRAFDPRLAALLEFLAETGLRISEAVALTVADVRRIPKSDRYFLHINKNYSHGKLKLSTKNGEDRTVPLTARALELLREFTNFDLLRPETILWSSPNGCYWRASSLHRLLRRAGVKSTNETSPFHSLRHYYASKLVSRGVAFNKIARVTGHKDVAVLANVYGRHQIDTEVHAEIIEALEENQEKKA